MINYVRDPKINFLLQTALSDSEDGRSNGQQIEELDDEDVDNADENDAAEISDDDEEETPQGEAGARVRSGEQYASL